MFNLDIQEILRALALVLVIEGLMPFINPDFMRRFFVKMIHVNNQVLRFAGLTSMLLGVLLLTLSS